MRRRRRSSGGQIDMTPLLDVLFSILFIVLLAGAQSERDNAASARGEEDRLVSQIRELEEKLTAREDQMESYDTYHARAVIVTVTNFSDDAGHRLRLSIGLDPGEGEAILLGTDRLESVRARLRSFVERCLDPADPQPVYILFYCEKSLIYKSEYDAVVDTFTDLQTEHKEVFFKFANEGE